MVYYTSVRNGNSFQLFQSWLKDHRLSAGRIKGLNEEEIQHILEGQRASIFPKMLEKKDWYVKIIVRHLLVDSTSYLLEDLTRGLQTLGGLEAIKARPEQFRDVFTKEDLNSKDAIALARLQGEDKSLEKYWDQRDIKVKG